MKNLNDKVAVITGAGSGIGRELAVNLAAKGCRLALSDVSEIGLEETAKILSLSKGRLLSCIVDVSLREQVYRFADDVVEKFGQVDIVINNAGIASKGFVDEVTDEVFEKVININMWGVIYGSRAFMPYLKLQSESSLVNISSINGMFPFPGNGPYNMSKYAVLGLNETLMMELKGSSVKVLSVHPGGIKTNIANNSLNMNSENKEKFNKLLKTSAADAAGEIVKSIQLGKRQIFIGADAKFMNILKRLSPKLALMFSRRLADSVS